MMTIIINQKRTDFILTVHNIKDLKIDQEYITYCHIDMGNPQGSVTFDRFRLINLDEFRVIV